MEIRTVTKMTQGQPAVDGAGVHLIRVFGHAQVPSYDPFLLLDVFDSTEKEKYIKGFPFHPHRGIQTVTYLIEGNIEHKDTLGNGGVISDGDCQWMVAGNGIVHQEMPLESKRIYGCQLWINLPRDNKMMRPAYQDIPSSTIPEVEDEECRVRIIAGTYRDVTSPFNSQEVPTRYLDVSLKSGRSWTLEVDPSHTAVVYILEGEAQFDKTGTRYIHKQAFTLEGGDTVQVNTGEKPVRFLLIEAKPLDEPVAWGGPIVMNSRDELHQAFKELEEGTFLN